VAAITVLTVEAALTRAAETAQEMAALAVASPANSAEDADAKAAATRDGEPRLPLLARLFAAMARDAETVTTRDLPADTVVVVAAPDADVTSVKLSPRRATAALMVLAMMVALTDPVLTRPREPWSVAARTALAKAASNAALHALDAMESVARAAATRDGTHQLLRRLDAPTANAMTNTKFAAMTMAAQPVNAPSRARETAAVAQDAPRVNVPSRANPTVAEAQDAKKEDAPLRASLTAVIALTAKKADAQSRASLAAAEAQDAPRANALSRARLAAVMALDAHPEAATSSALAALSAEAVDADLAPAEAGSPDLLPRRPVTPDTLLSLDLTPPRRSLPASTAMVPAVKDAASHAEHATVLAAPSATTMATS